MTHKIIKSIETKNVEKIVYICEICNHEYEVENDAKRCEERHTFEKVPFKYDVGSFVQFSDWSDDRRGVSGGVIKTAFKTNDDITFDGFYITTWNNCYYTEDGKLITESDITNILYTVEEVVERKLEFEKFNNYVKKYNANIAVDTRFDDKCDLISEINLKLGM